MSYVIAVIKRGKQKRKNNVNCFAETGFEDGGSGEGHKARDTQGL